MEIPAINTFRQLEATVGALRDQEVYCTRFDETHGSILLSSSEISDMLALCRENGYGLLIGLGPRPEYDVKATFYRTQFGIEQGRQLNNSDAFAQCVDEAFRLCELGCRGITVYDVGVLKVLGQLRARRKLPPDLVLKTSSHCMATNPALASLFAECGADAITTAHDLGLPVLQAMRKAAPGTVLDIPTDVYKSKGGFIRWFELAEMVQISAPMFFKMGASVQDHPYDSVKPEAAAERVRRVRVGLEYLKVHGPGAIAPIEAADRLVCLPVAPGG
ncbi:collagenase-like protease [Bradyrhizobium sp. YR681]|nr:collagenase-like protease [Bradyrhizobium sp. YR681]